MSETSRWWRPRFRLASLLWLMLCIGLTMGTYRFAYQRGRDEALAQRTFVGRTQARTYDVTEILPATFTGKGVIVDFDALMRDLKGDVLPNTWQDRGGSATIAEFPSSLSLVVMHDEDGHERIATWMRRRREQLIRSKTPRIVSKAAKPPDQR